LKLPAEVQLALREELISMGHARALVGLESEKEQVALLKKVVKNHLSVRQTEELVQKAGQTEKTKKNPEVEEYPEVYTRLMEQLERVFSPDISIKKNAKGEGGKITIGFASDDELQAFLEKAEHIR
jgi:ParB family chromosome partitioning protein